MTVARRRLLIAFSVSLLIHGASTIAWLNLRPETRGHFSGIPTEVDGPDDREMVMNVLNPVIKPETPSKSVQPPPETLPPTIIRPKIDSIGVSGVTQSGTSPAVVVSLPNSPSSSPLHGKLKSGKSIVYVLDRSSSMGSDGRLSRACAAIRASLDQLSADCKFQIVAYNGAAISLSTQLVDATPTNRERAARWLEGLIAEGRSEHRNGLREALWLHPNAVFLLTDADDMSEKEVKAMRELFREPVFLSVALFGDSRRTNVTPLKNFAVELGGDVHVFGR